MKSLKKLLWLLICFSPVLQSQSLSTQGSDEFAILYNQQKEIIYQEGQGRPFIPASIIKILTSHAALHHLGEGYRFTTKVWINNKTQGESDIIIQGMGDPLLISEHIAKMALQIQRQGKSIFHHLILDDSLIKWQTPPGSANSANPYDAANGALIVNFNTINIKKSKHGKIESAEQQTPLTQMAKKLGNDLLQNKKTLRFNLGNDQNLSRQYSHQLIRAIFAKSGIQITSPQIIIDKPSQQSKLLLEYSSPPQLKEIVQSLLKYSNNFIANQLGLVMLYQQAPDKPVILEDAAKIIYEHAINNLGIPANNFQLHELSGLSRDNLITPEAMYTILLNFLPYKDLLRDYKHGTLAKSGGLKGISNLAGYIYSSQGMLPFIIHAKSSQKRDEILTRLQRLGQNYTNAK